MFNVGAPGLPSRYHQNEADGTSFGSNNRQNGCVACLLENYYNSCRNEDRLGRQVSKNIIEVIPNRRFVQRRHSISATARALTSFTPRPASLETARRRHRNFIPVANFKSKSQESDISNGAMIVGQRRTTQVRRSPTPPPNQLRSTKLNEKSKSRNTREEPAVRSASIVQLLSSRKFGSVGGLYNENSKIKKPKILSGLSRLWSKSQKKNASKDPDNEILTSTEAHSNGNKPRNAISQTSLNLHSGFSQVQSTNTPYRCAFFNYDNEAFAARLWEEYEEAISSTKCNTNSLRREKQQDRNSFDRRSITRRSSWLPTTQVFGQSILGKISGLEELIHEPQSLKEFLSVKYLVWSFRKFLLTEFSEENLDFWLECEEYKQLSDRNLAKKASNIYEKYVKRDSIREVNITVEIRKGIEDKLDDPDPTLFEQAQSHVYALMSSDSFKRFLKSDVYADLVKTFPPSTTKRKRPADAIRASFNKKLRR